MLASLLALDKKSVRSYDKDGRMRVEMANISKANICEYLGSEIPNWNKLGLKPDKMYRLLRDPKELEKSAPTFSNVQIIIKHIPVNADDHQPDLIVGCVGDVTFTDPYLQAPLMIWAREGIDLIESEEQRELSPGYHYTPVMEAGVFKGEAFDGRMTNIVGNHLCLVTEGRTGDDVVVGDAAPRKSNPTLKEFDMTKKTKAAPLSRKAAVLKGALLVSVPALLAQDAKAKLDTGMFDAALAGVNSKNFKSKFPGLIDGLKAIVKPHLAQDADIEDLVKVVEAFKDGEEMEGRDAETMPNSALPVKKPEGEDEEEKPWEKVRAKLKEGGMDAETLKACDAEMGYEPEDDEAEDNENETEEEKTARMAKEAKDKAAKDKAAKDKAARDNAKGMDAAVTEAVTRVRAEQKAIREAENAVRPYVGDIAMAHDSAEAIYRTAISALKPDLALDGFDLKSLKAMLELIPAPKTAIEESPIAMDAGALSDFEKRYPETKRFRK